MEVLRRILHDPMEVLFPLAVFAASMLLGYGITLLVRRLLRRWTDRTQSRPALILRQSLHGTLTLWVLIFSLHLAIQISDLPLRYQNIGAKVMLVLLIFSLTLMFARMAGNLIRYYGSEIPSALPVTTLTQNLAQLGVVILGVLVLLNQLGIPITPILTALGVGGLAVALALQDTLSNLFSGFYVAIAGQVRLGDYIKLNSGEEGYITDIGWRSTTIRSGSYNLIIVPNNKLSQAIVTNYNLPERRLAAQVVVHVGYDADAERAHQVLVEVVRQAAQDLPAILTDPAPNVLLEPGFGEFSLGFTVTCQVAEFAQQGPMRHELRMRIFKRFQAEGIGMAVRPPEAKAAGSAPQ